MKYDAKSEQMAINIKQLLKNPIKFHRFIDLIKEGTIVFQQFVEQMLLFFASNIDNNILFSIYQHILNDNSSDNYHIQEKYQQKLEIWQAKKQYYIDTIFYLLFCHLFDKKQIQKKFIQNSDQYLYYIRDLGNLGDFNSSVKFFVDTDCNFYYEKSFNEINDEAINTEIQILSINFKSNNDKYPIFIVHQSHIENEKIYIPYYPYKTLNYFLKNQIKNEIDISIADKLVLIKEIALGLKKLHENQIYHLNLNDSSIYINCKKDAYICNFTNDTNHEKNQTKLANVFYYRHPDLAMNPQSTKIEYEINREYTKYDIYSFGVLVNEIITLRRPDERFGNDTRSAKIAKVSTPYREGSTNTYYDFIMQDFNESLEIKDIIEKCMKGIYENVEMILSDIDKLINEKQPEEVKNEVEYRILNADDPCKYKCELGDLVYNCYQGNEDTQYLIESFLNNSDIYTDYEESNEIFFNEIDEDMITVIFNFFDFKNDTNTVKKMLYKYAYNYFIRKNALSLLDPNQSCYLNDVQKVLMTMSVNAINNSNESSFSHTVIEKNLIPITSLDSFIKKVIDPKTIRLFAYMIAKELGLIHSYNLYHGELSLKSIGIYYDNEADTFVPSIIPFYFFYQNRKGRIFAPYKKENIKLDKGQRKDIRDFFKIIREFEDYAVFIPPEIFQSETMNEILFYLYKANKMNPNFREIATKKDYSSLYLTQSVLYDIFVRKDKNDPIYKDFDFFLLHNKSDVYLDVYKAVKFNLEFSSLKILNIKRDIENDESIKDMLLEINEINDEAYKIIYETSSNEEETVNKIKNDIDRAIKRNDVMNMVTLYSLLDFQNSKMQYYNNLFTRMANKVVFRYLEINTTVAESCPFMIKRYLYSLNPKFNYKIGVKIYNCRVNKNNITRIVEKLGHKLVTECDNMFIIVKKDVS
ncbi:hypothetical protein M9Y10_007239 [Tritrichomonas musculus]|uniref:Protein kinase domain-containing protein n=1 Tax=Tritrichomonas musculus TaxID=1915356 RepID=A0ABR2J3B6_9EUKA